MSNFIPREVSKVALALCDGLAGSRSDQVKNLIATQNWDELVTLTCSPSAYTDPESYFRDAACISFLRKYESLPTTFDRKKNAVKKFFDAERKCFRTNQRLLPFLHGTFQPGEEAIYAFIKQVRKEVTGLIGERPPSNPKGKFGPGATFSDRGGLTTIPDKMQSRPELTRGAWPFLIPWGGTLWAKAAASRGDSITFQEGNRFTTVPKDSETDRGISIECSVNLFYQLAYGSAMREALKKNTSHRLVLEEMPTIHRQVAREASLTGKFATIDITQASDTICKSLVALVLPVRWHEVLDDLRSPKTIINQDGVNKVVLLEKFSSMGNGYTFELETVIFMAICSAVMRLRGTTPKPGINVYTFGDDMIVPTEFASEVISALRYLGMDFNPKKTFVDGPFRESCGGDYFSGVDVRPFFLKKEVNEPQHYIGMANGIRRMALTGHRAEYRWHRVMRAWFSALDSIPERIRRCRGPSELGDICIHDEIANWETRWRGSIRYIRVYRPATYRKVKWTVFDPDVMLAGACYGVGGDDAMGRHNNLIPRDSVTGYKTGWVSFS